MNSINSTLTASSRFVSLSLLALAHTIFSAAPREIARFNCDEDVVSLADAIEIVMTSLDSNCEALRAAESIVEGAIEAVAAHEGISEERVREIVDASISLRLKELAAR